MKRRWIGLGIAALLGGAAYESPPGESCMAIPMRPENGRIEMRLAEQKALLYQQGKLEHLLLSVRYDGATDQFAWIIPTEGKPKVDVQEGAPFHELSELTRIQAPRMVGATADGGAKARAPGAAVEVIERKEAGPYDLAVLRARSGGGLYTWLRKNGFGLNATSRAALQDYVDKNYYFVAARIRPGAHANQSVRSRLAQGTIAPIHLIYPARTLSYPLKVTQGNPGFSEMELYVLRPGKASPEVPGLTRQVFKIKGASAGSFEIQEGPPGALSRAHCPTLRKLFSEGTLTKYRGGMTAAQRHQDLHFAQL